MPELLLELFSEEIPARMQTRAAEDLSRLVGEALAPLTPTEIRTFSGPRRIALAARVAGAIAESRATERGPRANAPEQALAGFLRKHGATREDLRQDGDFWILHKITPGIDAASLIAREIPPLLRRFPWPKSMRWGSTSSFTWVRPLRRILCILDGAVVPFDLRDGVDDGHGLASASLTEGHRFLSPGAFSVASAIEWQDKLRARYVIADSAERRAVIAQGLSAAAARLQLAVVDDPGLLDEVTGLVEWPVVLTGRIDDAYMELPAEVMQVSMRVNQRYFAMRDREGRAAPAFAFAANIEATDGGKTVIAGNERVLRARFADARHFWDLDRAQRLESRVPALDAITFHAKLGSQGERVRRLVALAGLLSQFTGASTTQAERAALLAKADLTTGMVGEFPELQGVMGRYYALNDGEDPSVADAIRDHYAPKGPSDDIPANATGVATALADKLDQLAGFFVIGEKPTGSGDPYALRRAALGVIRIVREKQLRFGLRAILEAHWPLIERSVSAAAPDAIRDVNAKATIEDLLAFLAERLRVQLRAEGARHDVLAAVLGTGLDDDLVRLLARTDAVTSLLGTEDGANLLAAYRRAANILRIEERKDGPHDGPVDPGLLELTEERALSGELDRVAPTVGDAIAHEEFAAAMSSLASLRAPLDAFFDRVTVNDPKPELRRNRLRLLSRLRAAMNLAADFSKIEG
jgi:glycyl-tRNA synthetase beta chain